MALTLVQKYTWSALIPQGGSTPISINLSGTPAVNNLVVVSSLDIATSSFVNDWQSELDPFWYKFWTDSDSNTQQFAVSNTSNLPASGATFEFIAYEFKGADGLNPIDNFGNDFANSDHFAPPSPMVATLNIPSVSPNSNETYLIIAASSQGYVVEPDNINLSSFGFSPEDGLTIDLTETFPGPYYPDLITGFNTTGQNIYASGHFADLTTFGTTFTGTYDYSPATSGANSNLGFSYIYIGSASPTRVTQAGFQVFGPPPSGSGPIHANLSETFTTSDTVTAIAVNFDEGPNPPSINPPRLPTTGQFPLFPVPGTIIAPNVSLDRFSLVVNAIENSTFIAGQYVFYTKNNSIWYRFRTATSNWSNEYLLTCGNDIGVKDSQTQFDANGYPVTVFVTNTNFIGIHYWVNGVETTTITSHQNRFCPNSIVTTNIIIIMYIPPGYSGNLLFTTSKDNFVKECIYSVNIPGNLQSFSLKQYSDYQWTFSFSTLTGGINEVFFATT